MKSEPVFHLTITQTLAHILLDNPQPLIGIDGVGLDEPKIGPESREVSVNPSRRLLRLQKLIILQECQVRCAKIDTIKRESNLLIVLRGLFTQCVFEEHPVERLSMLPEGIGYNYSIVGVFGSRLMATPYEIVEF